MRKVRKAISRRPQKRWLLVELIGGRRGRGCKGQLIFWTFGGEGCAVDWRRGAPAQLIERDRKRLIAIFNHTLEAHRGQRLREEHRREVDAVGRGPAGAVHDLFKLKAADKIVRQATGGNRNA